MRPTLLKMNFLALEYGQTGGKYVNYCTLDMEGSYDDVIKKVESLVFCSEKGMEVLLRMLVLEMKGELSLNTSIADQARIDRAKHLIYHWVLGRRQVDETLLV